MKKLLLSPIGESDRSSFENLKTYPQWRLKLEILKVYPSKKYDTVIPEIYFDGIDVH
jgi:hypothetical protein